MDLVIRMTGALLWWCYLCDGGCVVVIVDIVEDIPLLLWYVIWFVVGLMVLELVSSSFHLNWTRAHRVHYSLEVAYYNLLTRMVVVLVLRCNLVVGRLVVMEI